MVWSFCCGIAVWKTLTMAKLKSRSFKGSAKTGDRFEYLAEVSVDMEGIFSVTLEDELEHSAQSMLKLDQWRNKGMHLTRPRTNLRVSGPVLDELEHFINKVIEEFLHCEERRELVILYGSSIKVAYSKNDAGEFGPNNCVVQGGQWRGTLNATAHAPHFSIGFAAVVREKITTSRAASTKVAYLKPERPNTFQPELYIDKLNSFVGLRINESGMQEMPYTEEAAKFFYDTMIGMCVMADRIDAFFGSKERLLLAIDRQTPLIGRMSVEE